MTLWYIGPNGNDANAGTVAQPFATATAAAAAAQPGDTVYFLSGTYRNASFGALDGNGARDIWNKSDSIIKLNDVHGTAEAPITFAAAPGAHVLLQYDGNGAIVARNSSHLRFEGFEIEGPAASMTKEAAIAAQWQYRVQIGIDGNGDPVYEIRERDPAATLMTSVAQEGGEKPILFNAAAISLPNGSHHIEIVGNNVHHSAAHAVSAHGGNDWITVRNNTISDNTQLTSNGTHAISFKALDSSDTYDGTKIVVEGNTLSDNYNLLISWAPTKKAPVTMAIDEGKSIHVQNSSSVVDAETGNQWNHGQVLIADNLVLRSGNAGITVNEASSVVVANNTVVDAGYVNRLLAQDDDIGSPYYGFFSGQGLAPGFQVSAGGVRLSGADNITVVNNLIAMSDPTLRAVDAAADVTSLNTTFANNLYAGGSGILLRSQDTTLAAGFSEIPDPGFQDPTNGDFRLLASSAAIDAGSNSMLAVVGADLNGMPRTGSVDVGAFELAQAAPNPQTSQFVLNAAATGFMLDPSSPDSGFVGTTRDGLPIWSAVQTAAHISAPGGTWASYAPGLVVTYTFDASQISTTLDAQGNPAYTTFDTEYQLVTRQVLNLFEQITGLTFIEVTGSQAANISFQNIVGQSGGGGWASYPSQGGGHVSIGYPWTAHDVYPGSYVFHTIQHEVGHAIGLAHPGPYNGSADHATQTDYWNDSNQYSMMSYYGESYTGGSFGTTATPMLHDVLAMQMEYGANWSTRVADTVYGFNSTTGEQSYDFNYNNRLAFAIWDGGGTDALDFSGFSTGTIMDLREGGFSSTGLDTYNVAVAYGVVIENAVGGLGDDRMLGNATSNTLQGGVGHDVMFGGSETNVVAVVDPRDFMGIQLNVDPLVRNQYLSAGAVRSLSSGAFTIEMLVEIARGSADLIPFVSYAVGSGSAANEILIEGDVGGFLAVTVANVTHITTITTESVIDGEPHRLSVSWDGASGRLNTYIDGALRDTAIVQQGASIRSGGTLVFGQEQDSLAGGFQTSQVLQGTIGDIRIFEDVRTDTEIANGAFVRLTGSEQGLVNNWQVQSGDVATVVDLATANPPVNLTDLMPSAFLASQSSSYDSASSASNILDDNTGTFNHTLNTGNEWLLLSFSQTLSVDIIEITNRPSWGSRLDGATVSLLDGNGNVLFTSSPIAGAASGGIVSFTLPHAIDANAVRINQTTNFLHVAEINVFGTVPVGVTVPPATLNTDLAIVNGGTVRDTTPVINLAPDNDVLIGGAGNDVLHGGAGNDVLYGQGTSTEGQAGFAPTFGIEMNASPSVTNQYAVASGYAGLSGASNAVQFTIEMLVDVARLPSDEVVLVSYANTQTSNALIVSANTNGTIEVTFRGTTQDTGVASSSLTSGEHRFSLAWDGRVGGGYVLYIDGAAVFSGTHPNQTWSLTTGGTLIFGQEQDSVGGGFSANQIFPGTIADIRIFNDVRTASEIAANSSTPLANPADEQGLVSNWQVTSGNTALVTDAAGGQALTLVGGSTMVLFGNWDDDTLNGGIGDDTLEGGTGADALNGGDGVDIAAYTRAAAGVTVDLAQPSSNTGVAAGDTFNSIESLTGSNFDDTLIGDASANGLYGGQGNDVLDGDAGADLLLGGIGSDTLNGGDGADTAAMSGIRADYLIVGTARSATITDLVSGRDGLDQLQNVENIQFADGTFALSTLFATPIMGSSGRDTALSGTAAADVIYGLADDDFIFGLGGADTINGDDGYDTLYGGAGNDALFGGANEDVVVGDEGDDTLQGGDGGDILSELFYPTTSGNDLFDGGNGVDIMYAASGNDIVSGGNDAANNYANLGDGQDTYHGSAGNDVVEGGNDADTINGNTGDDSLYGDAGNDVINGGVGIDLLSGSAGDDQLNGGADNDLIIGDAGNDTMLGGSGVDILYGFADNDILEGGAGTDGLYGGVGADTFRYLSNAAGAVDYDYLWDFEAGAAVGDVLQFSTSVFANRAALTAASYTSGGNTTIQMGNSNFVVLVGVSLANMHANDFQFV